MSAGLVHQALKKDYEELQFEGLSQDEFDWKSKGLIAINPQVPHMLFCAFCARAKPV